MDKQSREEAEQSLRAYLSMLKRASSEIREEGYKYGSPAELLLETGASMGGEDSAPDTDLVELIARVEYHGVKQCYYNCTMLAEYADWNYCEGYVVRGDLPIPIMHAWLELDGYVYDPTIRKTYSIEEEDIGVRIANNNEDNFYFGVRLNKDLVIASGLERGKSFSVLQDYEKKYPVLKENSLWLL